MRKTIALVLALSFGLVAKAQNSGYFYGDFQSNSQWLQSDSKLGFEAPDAQFRANNYLRLNYSYGKFTAGLQYEMYQPQALLDYAPILNGKDGIASYFLKYRGEKLSITAGYFYDQFGSGLILRSYENRQLGINNAIRGIQVKYRPTSYLTIKGDYGKQRYGFGVSEGFIQGVDVELDVSQFLNLGDWYVDLGGSYVGRYQNAEQADTLPHTTNAFAARLNFAKGQVYGGVEYVQLGKKVLVNNQQISNPRLFDGNALLVNLGYAKSGFAINGTFRRMDNFSFYSDRMAQGNQYNQQLINYVPALTKKQDYLLANIYVYQAQPRLFYNRNNHFEARSGEVGTQWDVYYTAKRGTAIGGEYGTEFSANFSYWAGLDTEFNFQNDTYDAAFIGEGPRYYRDFNFEIRKRWSEHWSSVVTYLNQIIDESITNGGVPGAQGEIKAQVGVVESTYEFGDGQSIRLALQHLWTQQDRNNWAAAMIEYYLNPNLSVFAADSWNYGGDKELHYYNIGLGYSKGRVRFAMKYGRTRGGLLCVGGVCRYVSSNTGLSMNIAVSF